MNTFTSLRDALNALPVGPEAIADHLAATGVQGTCREPGRCVIAEYLAAVLDVPLGFYVKVSNQAASFSPQTGGTNWLELCWFGGPVTMNADHVSRPDIAEFIQNFDRGEYPLLVAGPDLDFEVAA